MDEKEKKQYDTSRTETPKKTNVMDIERQENLRDIFDFFVEEIPSQYRDSAIGYQSIDIDVNEKKFKAILLNNKEKNEQTLIVSDGKEKLNITVDSNNNVTNSAILYHKENYMISHALQDKDIQKYKELIPLQQDYNCSIKYK